MEVNGGKAEGGAAVNCIVRMVDGGSVESKMYYMARRTVLEMVRDRGYAVAVADLSLSLSLSGFRAFFGQKPDLERLRVSAARLTNPTRKIIAIFCGTADIGKQAIVGILSQIMNKENLDRIILVLQSKMTSHAKKVLEQYPVKVETFRITDLLVNVTKHVLEPRHEILSAEEKKCLLKKYNVEDKKLPIMVEGDAIARYYGLHKGQVVKITYSGPLTDSIVTYRCIV